MNVISPETRMMGLPYGEEIMIVGRTMCTQSTSVTDGQTDRITITKTVQRIASHGKNGHARRTNPSRRLGVLTHRTSCDHFSNDSVIEHNCQQQQHIRQPRPGVDGKPHAAGRRHRAVPCTLVQSAASFRDVT